MARRSKVGALPAAVREWLTSALVASQFGEYEQLSALLAEQGYDISKSAVQRYGTKLERSLAAIKSSTEAAAAIAAAAPDDADLRSAAVISMVQTGLFDVMLALEAAKAETDPVERMELLGKAAKGISELSRASINQKKHQGDVRAKVRAEERAKAAEMATTVAKAKGLSAATVAELRKEILGVV